MTTRTRKLGFTILMFLSGFILLFLASCGGGGGGGGGASVEYEYTVNLTPEKTMVEPGGTVNLNPKVDAPANQQGITWSVSCKLTDCGTVSATGIYTAPAAVSEQIPVHILAKVTASPTHTYSTLIWVKGKIVVEISPDWPIMLVTGATQQFSATVNSPDTQIIWLVNGVTGGNPTVGTITTAGLYTAPAAVPDPDKVTVAAVAHADQTASATKEVTITPPPIIGVSISPRDQTVTTSTTLQFTATVVNTNDTAVVWKVNGTTGGNATVGTISAGGLYTAPATVPSPATVTVSAYSHADATKYDSTAVTVIGTNDALLTGPYTFELSGPGNKGWTVAMIGALVADGKGNIIGLLDYNDVGASSATTVHFTGSYIIGSDNRGTLTFDLAFPARYAFTINSAGTNAKLIEFDSSTGRLAGFLERQTATDLSLAKFTGDYALSLAGSGGGYRETAVGRFHSDGLGAISNGSFDAKWTGEAAISATNLTGTASLTDPTYGRGTFTLMESATDTFHFSFYITNGGELLLMATDEVSSDVPLFVGRAFGQSGGPFSNTSLNGNSVFSLAGFANYTDDESFLTVGQWSAIGSTQSLTGVFDQIVAGSPVMNQAFTATYSVAANGRGTLTSSELPPLVFYMIAPNKAVVMQTEGNEEQIGMIEPQSAGPFTNAYFNGTYRIGPISRPVYGAGLSQGNLTADGSGAVSAVEDVNDQAGPVQSTFNGTYTVAANGRMLMNITSPEAFQYVAYPVSTTRFVGISLQAGDVRAVLASLDQ